MVVMVVGALLVAGLVGWALTRTVEPANRTPATTEVATTAVTSGQTTTPAPLTTGAESPVPSTPGQIAPVQNTTTSLIPGAGIEPPDAHQQTPEKASVPRMAVEDVRSMLSRELVLVVDVRDQASYERAHIPGAMHVPLASLEANLTQLPKNKRIVTYCT
jgi:hypothetical protein